MPHHIAAIPHDNPHEMHSGQRIRGKQQLKMQSIQVQRNQLQYCKARISQYRKLSIQEAVNTGSNQYIYRVFADHHLLVLGALIGSSAGVVLRGPGSRGGTELPLSTGTAHLASVLAAPTALGVQVN